MKKRKKKTKSSSQPYDPIRAAEACIKEFVDRQQKIDAKRTKEEKRVLEAWNDLDDQYKPIVMELMKKLKDLPATITKHVSTSSYSMRTDDSGPGPYKGDPGYIHGPGDM